MPMGCIIQRQASLLVLLLYTNMLLIIWWWSFRPPFLWLIRHRRRHHISTSSYLSGIVQQPIHPRFKNLPKKSQSNFRKPFLPLKNLFRPSKLFLFNKLCSKTKQLGRYTKIWKGQKRFFKVWKLKFVKLQNETFWIIFKTFCDSYLVLKPLKVELRRNFLATNSRLLTKVKNFSHDQLFIQESYFRPTTAIHDVVVPSLECLLLHKMMIDFDGFVSSGTTQGKSLGNRKVLLIGWL